MIIASYQFEIFADYHQFYLEDEAATIPDPESVLFYQSDGMQTFAGLALNGNKDAADRYWLEHLAQEHARLMAKDNLQWTNQAVADMVAIGKGKLAIGTVRNLTVPVTVEIHDREPQDSFDEWDHVTEASIDVPSGKIVITEPTCYPPDAPRIPIKAGMYCARIYYGSLDKIDEMGIEGEDHYRIALWPGTTIEPHVLKRWRRSQSGSDSAAT